MKFGWFYILGVIFVSAPVIAELDEDVFTEEAETENEESEELSEEYEEEVPLEEFIIEDADIEEVKIDTGAAEQRVVSERLTCAQISERIDDLRQDVMAYPEKQPELEKMVGRFRSQCAQTIKRRPVRNYEHVNPVTEVEVPEVLDVVVEQAPEVAPAPKVVTPKPVIKQSGPAPTAPAETKQPSKEEIAANAAKFNDNLAHGLCGDGTKPNKYGCCAGEVFKEIAQMKFACCMKSNLDDCVEPIKKK